MRHDLIEQFYAGLSDLQAQAVRAAESAATAISASLFLAGGPVRDLELGREVSDIDIAVEGDVEQLAGRLEAATGLRVVRHGRFGTATLRGGAFTIDFARTRRESYRHPGALPDIEVAAIDQDLARRDFTINAMALRLTPPAGEFFDPHAGAADLERRLIRILHERSFEDDATRMLRACRYAARLGFQIEKGTESLIRRDLQYLDAISGPRLRRELMLALRDPGAVDAVALARRLDVLASTHPLLSPSPALDAAWREALAGEHHAAVDEFGLCMTAACRAPDDVEALSSRLHLTGRLQGLLRDLVRLLGLSAKLNSPRLTPPEAVDALDGREAAAVWAAGLKMGGGARENCVRYLREWRRVRPSLNGFDLEAMGVPRGPDLGSMLRELRAARLTGAAGSRAEEVALVRQRFPDAVHEPPARPPGRRR
jgi:tRNA nucleotidyltransferase (CCA-adding enzyme)